MIDEFYGVTNEPVEPSEQSSEESFEKPSKEPSNELSEESSEPSEEPSKEPSSETTGESSEKSSSPTTNNSIVEETSNISAKPAEIDTVPTGDSNEVQFMALFMIMASVTILVVFGSKKRSRFDK